MIKPIMWSLFLPPHSIVMARRNAPQSPSFVVSGNLDSPIIFLSASQNPETQSMTAEEKQLLDKMVQAMGLDWKRTGLLEIIHPPFNWRSALPSGKTVIALGKKAVSNLNEPEINASQRGIPQPCALGKIIITHHPGELLKNPTLKREAWTDLQQAMRVVGGCAS